MNPGIPEPPPLSAPPPPPPPPAPGQVPTLRISTASELGPRKPQFIDALQDPYEPPAAIQNAMMTKDKKPFTYTPGMGGKLDLSQIRSPRMARRVAKNANDEGIEGPPKSSLAQEPRSPPTPQPQQQQPSMYAQPQVAVPVFPQGMPQQPVVNLKNSTLPRSPSVIERVEPAPRPVMKVETKMQPVTNLPDTPTPPISPTQVTLAKAPTPWMQKQVKQQEELPEWAKRSNNRSQDSSSSGSESPLQTQTPSVPRQIIVVNPPRQPPEPQQQMRPARHENEHIVPLRIEDRPSVFSALNESGHHQLSNTTPHHQSRWGNPVGQSAPVPQSPGGTYLVPVQVDDQQYQMHNAKNNHNQMQYRNVTVENQTNRNVPRVQVSSQQVEPGPVQSKSFRVLQKITDTDLDQIDGEQVRKLQLTEDDRCLMNKFKEQVDGDTYLHKEEDPRYRGAAIPSRAFRYLQNMTDTGDGASTNSTPKPVNPAVKKQNRNSKTFEEVPVYVPASEQQVPEPKKYMGGAIPSRSFRILQAMTAPESVATQVLQENRQDLAIDFVSGPGNQQEKNSESEEDAEEEGSCPSSKMDDDEENTSAESSDSSCDSDFYMAYSTGLNTQKHVLLQKEAETKFGKSGEESNYSTDCEKESLLAEEHSVDEKKYDDQDDKRRQSPNKEDLSHTTVSVKLPLRFKFSVSDKNEDVTTVTVGNSTVTKDVDTCVDFTLKRPKTKQNSTEKADEETHKKVNKMVNDENNHTTTKVKPTFIVTTTDEDKAEEIKYQEDIITNESISEKRKTLLSVQSHSKEEVTDDEDSGVTSDMSRIISEVDTDSECCVTTTQITAASATVTTSVCTRRISKYKRVQTHSRLFRLLNDEQLKLPVTDMSSNQEEQSSNSSGLTSPDCTLMDESSNILGSTRRQLPTRPKSLDCGSLFNRNQDDQLDPYYQTWKNGESCSLKKSLVGGVEWPYPKVNVVCPRIKCAKSMSQTLAPKTHQQLSRMKSPLGSITISSSIPSPVRASSRC